VLDHRSSTAAARPLVASVVPARSAAADGENLHFTSGGNREGAAAGERVVAVATGVGDRAAARFDTGSLDKDPSAHVV
jgi:hypothetical protein